MTLPELYQILCSSGYPVAYKEFKSAPTFPCIAYIEVNRDNVLADDSIYLKFKNIRIELYTDKKKDPHAEQHLEEVLEQNGLIYSYDEVGLIESENLYEIVYEIQI